MQKINAKNDLVFPTLMSQAPSATAGGATATPASFLIAAFVILFASFLHAASLDKAGISTPEDAILAKAFSAYMDGKDKRALSYFEEVARLNPHNKAAKKGLEKVKIRLKKAEAVEKQKSRRLAEAKVKEGRKLLETNDVVAAIDSFHTAVDAIAQYKPAVKQLEAIKDRMLKEANRRQMNLATWSFARGVLAYLDRDWARAYRIWSERNRIEPENVPLTNAVVRAKQKFEIMMTTEREDFFRRGGRAFYEQGLYREAQNAWEQVLLLNTEDVEALEGKARSEDATLRAQGKNRDTRINDLLEQALDYYANQSWRRALETFTQITQLDPNFSTAKEYISKLNQKLTEVGYRPVATAASEGWRAPQASDLGESAVGATDRSDNFDQARRELESQLKRDPSNIRIQQELDRVIKRQEDESERVYKDGLIAYSQGNRSQAIHYWRQVLLIHPDHKKASAALAKARAEEARPDSAGGQP